MVNAELMSEHTLREQEEAIRNTIKSPFHVVLFATDLSDSSATR
jgi:hypothetical protein